MLCFHSILTKEGECYTGDIHITHAGLWDMSETCNAIRHSSMVPLTEALGFLSTPVAVALACQHSGQGQLVTLVAGVAYARAPGEICPNNLSVRDGGWWTAYNCYKKTERHYKTLSIKGPTLCSGFIFLLVRTKKCIHVFKLKKITIIFPTLSTDAHNVKGYSGLNLIHGLTHCETV